MPAIVFSRSVQSEMTFLRIVIPLYLFCLSMISAQTPFGVCREGKPVPTFPDHALSNGIDRRRRRAAGFDRLARGQTQILAVAAGDDLDADRNTPHQPRGDG